MLCGCGEPTPRGSSSARGARQPAVEGRISGSRSGCARECVGVGAESQVVRRRCRLRSKCAASHESGVTVATMVGIYMCGCMMCAHTDNLCVSDLYFMYTFIFSRKRRSERTICDMTERTKCMQSASGTHAHDSNMACDIRLLLRLSCALLRHCRRHAWPTSCLDGQQLHRKPRSASSMLSGVLGAQTCDAE